MGFIRTLCTLCCAAQDLRILIIVPRLPVLLSELIPNSVEERFKLWLRLTVSRTK